MAKKKNSELIRYAAHGMALEPGGRCCWVNERNVHLFPYQIDLENVGGDPSKALMDGESRMICQDGPGGNWWYVERKIDYSLTPSLHACDWRCQRAKRSSCECSCRGANHGAGTRFVAESA